MRLVAYSCTFFQMDLIFRWSQSFGVPGGELLVRGDGTLLVNIQPLNATDISGYSYYLINASTQVVASGIPGSQVSAVQGNTFYIRQIGEVILNYPYSNLYQFTNISQVAENGNILRTFNLPPNRGNVNVTFAIPS